jgi:hypothetical protein
MSSVVVSPGYYSIPSRLRRMENMHILFWLLKDVSWCLDFKPLAILMIFPTLIVAIWITHKNRLITSELANNLAVIFWITANSVWMLVEFMAIDEDLIWRNFTGRHLAIIPFTIGLLILVYYYLFNRKAETEQTPEKTEYSKDMI